MLIQNGQVDYTLLTLNFIDMIPGLIMRLNLESPFFLMDEMINSIIVFIMYSICYCEDKFFVNK